MDPEIIREDFRRLLFEPWGRRLAAHLLREFSGLEIRDDAWRTPDPGMRLAHAAGLRSAGAALREAMTEASPEGVIQMRRDELDSDQKALLQRRKEEKNT